MRLETIADALDVSVAEGTICRYHNQAFIDLFETIAQIIKELKEHKQEITHEKSQS